MKKILSILLMALAAAGMTACGTEGEPSPEAEQQPSSQQTAAEDPAAIGIRAAEPVSGGILQLCGECGAS